MAALRRFSSRVLALAVLVLLSCATLQSSAARPSKGCGKKPRVEIGATTALSIMANGLNRTYRLRVPASCKLDGFNFNVRRGKGYAD